MSNSHYKGDKKKHVAFILPDFLLYARETIFSHTGKLSLSLTLPTAKNIRRFEGNNENSLNSCTQARWVTIWSLLLKRNCTRHLLKMRRKTLFKAIARESKDSQNL